MKKFFNAAALSLLIVMVIAVFAGCQKDVSATGDGTKQRVQVYLNDDPSIDFAKVLVDIRYVEVKIDSSRDRHNNDDDNDDDDDHHGHDRHGNWDTLMVTPGLYDLLRLRNGVDTLLAQGTVLNGTIKKIRFTLGDNSRVYTDSINSAPLRICDNRHYVYVKIKHQNIDTIPGGQIRINIDFDVSKSIKIENGQFCLKPKLKPYGHHNSGKLEGKVFPYAARPLVKAYNATDTAYAIPWENGKYKISGLAPGTYTVLFDATVATYRDTSISNVRILRERETELPTITLHQ
jgi:Domain of unknown function (DUF4382)